MRKLGSRIGDSIKSSKRMYLRIIKKSFSLLLVLTLMCTSFFSGPNMNTVQAVGTPYLIELIPDYNDTYALMSDGTVMGCGLNSYGELGQGNTNSYGSFTSIPNVSDVKKIIPAYDRTYVILNDGTVMDCGRNQCGQLGQGDTNDYHSFTAVSGLTDVVDIYIGESCAYALLADGTVKDCGSNTCGKLGQGYVSELHTFTTVSGLSDVTKMIVDSHHEAFAILDDGAVKDCGMNYKGVLGHGNTSAYYYFTAVSGLSDVKDILLNFTNVYAILNDGTVKDCGANEYGQLGQGNTNEYHTFTAVPGLSGVVELTGYGDMYALLSNGRIMDCGANSYGELGQGNTNPYYYFTTVPALYDVQQIIGSDFTYVLLDDGTVKDCGSNYYGELGQGNNNNYLSFTTVPGLTNVERLVRGATCRDVYAIFVDGTVKDCGINTYGELGQGNISQYNSFTAVQGLSSLNKIINFSMNSFAIMDDGTVKDCGADMYGVLGLGAGNHFRVTSYTSVSAFLAIVPPEISLSEGDWSNVSVTITADITDDCGDITAQKWASGSQDAEYFETSGTIFTGSTFEVIENGIYTVYAINNAGQKTVETIIVDHIDTVSPEITHQSFTTSSTITPTILDADSGILATKYATGSQNAAYFASGGTTFTDSFQVSSDGVYTIFAIDNAGNTDVKTVTVDTGAPVITCSDTLTTSTITPDISDNGSGIAATKYASGDQAVSYFTTGGTAFTTSFNVSSDGIYTIYAIDNADNTSIKTIMVDANAPSIPANLTLASATNDGTTLFWDASTDTIGVTGYKIYRDSVLIDESTSTSYTDTELADDTTYVYTVAAFDEAGNISGESKDITVSTLKKLQIGGYTQTFNDLTVNSPGLPIDISRTYNSFDDTTGVFGRGWTFSYSASCKPYQYTYTAADDSTQTETLLNIVLVNLPDGSTETFNLIDDEYVGSGTRDILVQNANGTFTLTKNKITYDFNANGYLVSIIDANGNTTTITVDANGKPTLITDSVDREYSIAYSNGLISTITDPIDRVVTYNYTDGILTSVDDPMDNVMGYYEYDTSDFLIDIEDASQNDIQSIAYDHNVGVNHDRVISITDSDNNITEYSYDNINNQLTTTDSEFKVNVYEFDENNYLSRILTDGNMIDYNVYGEIVSSIDASSNETDYQYDTEGNLTNISYPNDDTEDFTYDVDGNLETKTDVNGKKTFYQYDSYGNMTKQAIQKDGTTIDYTDICDQSLFDITQYSYYANGLTHVFTEPDASTITYTYNSYGNPTSIVDSVSGTTTCTYNDIGWVTSRTTPDSVTTSFVYDDVGRVIKTTCGSDITRFVYDTNGRLIQKINPDQYDPSDDGLEDVPQVNTYSDNTVGYRYTYNAGGILLTETLPNNEAFSYDDTSKISSVYNPATGAVVSNIDYTYDDNSNIETISEGNAQKVKYYYDTSNQLTREDNVWQNLTFAYAYDTNGNLLTKKSYTYTTITDISAETPIHIYSYLYEDTNNPDRLTSYDGNAITYDTNGNTLTFNGWTYTWDGTNLDTASNTGNSISYEYNDDGIRTSKTVNSVTTDYTIDSNNNITSETDGTDTINYVYDINGSLQYMTLNSVKYYYEKNAMGDITGLIDSNNNEVVHYSYDSWGRLLNIGGTLAGTVGAKNSMRYRSYYYDTETGLYYLQSRYYSPDFGRFISEDDPVYHNGMTGVEANMYAYCKNNPVMMSDPTGHFSIPFLFSFKNGVLSINSTFFALVLDAFLIAIFPSLATTVSILGFSFRFMGSSAILSIFQKQMVPTMFAVFNSLLTAIRYCILKFTGYAVQLWSRTQVSNVFLGNKAIYLAYSCTSIGAFIGTLFDILDGRLDGNITI
ncbi:MAG: RHS repeat-associated core domain-containing protein [Saccharofermentanales bacterium]